MRVRNFFMLSGLLLLNATLFGQAAPSWVAGSGAGTPTSYYLASIGANLNLGVAPTIPNTSYKLLAVGSCKFATNTGNVAGYAILTPGDGLTSYNTSLELCTGGNSQLTTQIDFKGGLRSGQDFWGRISHTDGTGFDFFSGGPGTLSKFRVKADGKVIVGDPAVVNSASNEYKLFVQTGINTPKILIGDPSTVNTTLTDYSLFVDGGIIAEKVKVALCCGVDWSDYVFAPDYELLSLDSVNTYIQENQHLPGVPSSEEVQENGIEVARMDALLLQKIEELTLYMIQLKKENEELQKEIQILKDEKKD